MADRLIQDFIKEQTKLMNAPSHSKPAMKTIIKPDMVRPTVEDTIDEKYNNILEKKPAPKKVIKFLQECVDSIMAQED